MAHRFYHLFAGVSVAASAVGMLAAVPALAQAGAAPGEIVVTAQKREQKLQDVGLTVTALGGDQLENRRVANVEDLAKVVPGLSFAPSPNSTPVYTLRGVGFYESSLAAYPDVAIYIDQAGLVLPAMSALTAFDLERVEVLKGPQGTLFGNNATGGAINFVANKPTDTLRAGGEISYGRFNTVEFQGHVSGPLSDTLRARLAVKATKGDDWQYSYTRKDTLGETNEVAGRLLVEWEPTDKLTVNLNLNGWRDKSDPQAPATYAEDGGPVILESSVQNKPFNLVAAQALGLDRTQSPFIGYPTAPRNARAADWSTTGYFNDPVNYRPYANNKFWQAVMRVDYEVADDITATSITNYAHYDHLNGTDGDGTSLVGLDIPVDQGVIKSFTQEVRLASSSNASRFKWVLGANYEHTVADELLELGYYDASSNWGGNFQGFNRNQYGADQTMKNWAVFGNAEFEVVDNLTLKGGIRYTEAKREAAIGNYAVPGFVEPLGEPGIIPFFNSVWPALNPLRTTCSNDNGNDFIPIADDASFTLDPATCQAGTYFGKLKEHNTSWSIGMDYKVTPDVLLYVNVAKGYKAGSYPTTSAATWNQFVPVVQEQLLDYEGGFKATIPALKMTLNGAAFYYDYKNKQLRAKIVDSIFGFLDALVNVPKSTIKGAEIEMSMQPVDGLSLGFSATYLETKVKKFVGVDPTTLVGSFGGYEPQDLDFSGAKLPFSPKWQLAGSIDYSVPVTGDINAVFGASGSYQTKAISGLYAADDLASQKLYELNGRFLLDLSAGIKSESGWKAILWGKNVTNKYYWTNATFVYDNNVRYTGRPAEYGITIGYEF